MISLNGISKRASMRDKNKRILGKLEKIATTLGCSLSADITNGTHRPSASGVKLSGRPGKPSTKTSLLPALLPLRWYFIKRIALVSDTTKKSSWGLSATPFARANSSISKVLTFFTRSYLNKLQKEFINACQMHLCSFENFKC